MSIFTMNEVPFDYNIGEHIAGTPLEGYYSSIDNGKLAPLLTNLKGVTVGTNSGATNFIFGLQGTVSDRTASGAAGRFYTAETTGTMIFGFGSTDKIIGYHAFINGKTLSITNTDEVILIVRVKSGASDDTFIYTSNLTTGAQLSKDLGDVPNRGYCDKYLLTPMAYRGIMANNAFVADGGMSELSEGVCKIDNSSFYRVAKNILVKVDELIK